MKHQIFTLLTSALFFSNVVNAANEIKCSPSIVHPGEKLTIKTSRAFSDFAVDLPYKLNGHNSLFLSNGDPTTDLIDSKKFMQQKGIEIDVSTATFKQKSPLFLKSGVYKFTVSTNLETDDGTPAYTCKVNFVLEGGVKSLPYTTKGAPPAKPNTSTSVVQGTPAVMTSVKSQQDNKTLDELFKERKNAECADGFGGLICQEKIRFAMCIDKWSDNPPTGQSTCRGASTKQ